MKVWQETVFGIEEDRLFTIVSFCRLAIHNILAIGCEQRYEVLMVIGLVRELVVLLKEVDDGYVFDRCGQVGKLNAHLE